MRTILLLAALGVVGCGSHHITFDPSTDGGGDGSPTLDGSAPNPDGSVEDGGLVDGGKAKAAMYTSGSRLKVKYYAGADGSKSQIGLFDTALQIICYFSVAADSTTRCIPTATPASYFSDAGCTSRLVMVSKGCTPTKYASFVSPSQGCPSNVTHIAPMGGAISPAKYYYLNGSVCTEIGATAPSVVDYYGIGAELPASTFVAGTEMQEP